MFRKLFYFTGLIAIMALISTGAYAKQDNKPLKDNGNPPGIHDTQGDIPVPDAGDQEGDEPEIDGDDPILDPFAAGPGKNDNKPNKKDEVLDLFKVKGRAQGLIKLSKNAFYPGQPLKFRVVFPKSIKALWEGEADLHLLVRIPDGSMLSMPLYVEGETPDTPKNLFDLDFMEGFPTGVYQFALILTVPGGDPENLGDWYKGFGGLISAAKITFNEFCGDNEDDPDCDGILNDIEDELDEGDTDVTDVATDDSTSDSTDDSTDVTTDDSTSDSTDDSTDVVTDDSTSDSTDDSTSVATDDSTSDSTDDSTSVATDDSTSDSTDDSTSVATDDSTSDSTDDATSVATDDSTSDSTDDSTSVTTDDSTSDSTDDSTSVTTDDSTSDSTDDSTSVTTDDSTSDSTDDSTSVATDDSTSDSTDNSTDNTTDDTTDDSIDE